MMRNRKLSKKRRLGRMFRPQVFIFPLLAVLATAARADDFKEMLEDVSRSHPALQAEYAALQATVEGESEAVSGFFPTVVAGYDRGRHRIRYNSLPAAYEDTVTKQLVLTQPLFNGGETIAAWGAAQERTLAGKERFSLVKQQVLLDAVSAYVGMSEKQQVLDMVRENVEVLTTHLEGTRTQFAEGELTITDVSQSEARLARAQAELTDAEAALASARAAYIRATGKKPSVDRLPPLPASLPAGVQEVLTLADRHPALKQAEHNRKAADHTIDTRFAALLPDVSMQGLVRNSEGSSTPSINATDDRALMLQVSIPLYQSGAEYARLRQAHHQYEQADSQTRDTARIVREEALRQWHDYTAADEAIASHKKAIRAAEDALQSVRIEQMEGTRTVLDVLNAQEEWYAARINLLRAESRRVLAAYRLLASVGTLDKVTLTAEK
jgi:TolC family type I secretion outer membrane protein